MEPTAAPWARKPPGDAPPPMGMPTAGLRAAVAPGALPLPAVSRGELTRAPWAASSGPAFTGPAFTGRPVEAAVPHTQPRLPPLVTEDFSTHRFVPPAKRIQTPEQLKQFLRSETARDFVSFILALNEAVKGRQLSDTCQESEAVVKLVGVLDTLWKWVDEIPPAAHTLRYGNPAYRIWFAKMTEAAPQLMASVLPDSLQPAAQELGGYFADSFGNATRLDYGTGHETTFAALLYCLAKLGVVGPADAQALVTRVFRRYLQLMRKIQTTYWLEPAGSHGVWGLDDYQFLPFIWGSAQLVDHPFIKPSSILSHELLEAYASEYFYLGCVQFVKQVKKGPLQETSPMLVDISGIPVWSKVNSGMVKMYQAEVLAKFPIMQHFLFGSLIQWAPERLAKPHGSSALPVAPAAAAAAAAASKPAAATAAQPAEEAPAAVVGKEAAVQPATAHRQ